MSMMSNSFLPSACETDIAGLVGMYVLQAASDEPAALLDWNNNYGGRPRQGRRVPLLEPAEGVLHRISGWTTRRSSPARSARRTPTAPSSGRIAPGPFTYCRVSTDDFAGVITSYVGEGRFTDDTLDTFGGYGVIEVPDFQRLLQLHLPARLRAPRRGHACHGGAAIEDASIPTGSVPACLMEAAYAIRPGGAGKAMPRRQADRMALHRALRGPRRPRHPDRRVPQGLPAALLVVPQP
jgi:L-fucose isomerase-like protein